MPKGPDEVTKPVEMITIEEGSNQEQKIEIKVKDEVNTESVQKTDELIKVR
jgi:hypothetical protein